jgi:endonuclease/exonuclease/phosphatase family metal-dependent hydrolase
MESITLQIVTYNIHKGFSIGNRRFVLHQIRDALQVIDVDLVFLQEIQGRHTYREMFVRNWPDSTQLEFLAEELWPHRAYGKNVTYHAGHHGNAILSKHPIAFWENINVSPTRFASRSVLHGVIEVPGAARPIHVACIHFSISASERRKQLNILNERIRAYVPDDAPLIIAGDFNDWSGIAERYMKRGLGVNDVFVTLRQHPARTFPVWYPMLPVDRIFYRGTIPLSCQCLSKMPWRKLSDHAALYAAFNMGTVGVHVPDASVA